MWKHFSPRSLSPEFPPTWSRWERTRKRTVWCMLAPGESTHLWCRFPAVQDRNSWGDTLGDTLEGYQPDLIVLSGFMKLLPPSLVSRFSPHIINTHPSYLPEFPGAHAVRDAVAAGATQTGASVIVVDDGVDTGRILAQQRVPIHSDDTEDALHARIKILERSLLLDVLRTLIPNNEGTP